MGLKLVIIFVLVGVAIWLSRNNRKNTAPLAGEVGRSTFADRARRQRTARGMSTLAGEADTTSRSKSVNDACFADHEVRSADNAQSTNVSRCRR